MTYELIPSPPVGASRWPGLVASTGGEAVATGRGSRWSAGLRFDPDACGLNEETPILAKCDASQIMDLAASLVTPADEVSTDPFIIWEVASCSTFGSDANAVTGKARRRLQATTSHKIEAEFWAGAAQRANGSNGQYLTDGGATLLNGGASTSYRRALADLQHEWAACTQGAPGVIHLTTRVASLILSSPIFFVVDGLVRDSFGNVVVVGSGYDGSGEDHAVDATGDTAWMWMTSMPEVRLTPIEVTAPIERVDVANNVDMAVAYRVASVNFDPCCRIGVLASHCATLAC